MSKIISKIKRIFMDKDERDLFINIFFAFAIKGASLLISFFSMPLYIKYFNNDTALGLWYTILSLLSWISICDLGLGNGLRNRLTEALALNDRTQAKKYISSTYVAICLFILPLVLLVSIIICFLNWNAFFNVPASVLKNTTIIKGLTILLWGIGISFIFKIVNNIIYALQKSSLNNFLVLVTSILPLLYIIFFPSTNSIETNFLRLSIVHVISINLPLITATIILFTTKILKDCAPSLKHFDTKTAKGMLRFGLSFFLAQVFFLLLMSTNEIYISRLFVPDNVVEYSIYYKICTFIGSFFMLALTPLWSKVTKDFVQKNYQKIRKTNHFLYILAFLAIAVQFMMVFALQWIVDIWLKEETIIINYTIGLIFAGFGGVYILNSILTTVANGIGNLKSQLLFYGFGALLKIPVLLLFKYLWPNWSTVVLYNSFVLLLFSIYQMIWIEKEIKKLCQKENKL